MIAQNVFAAFVGLVVGVQAGPCKPSSVKTTTGTASTDVTAITSIATSGEPTTTTTEAATTTTSGTEHVCLKDPAPVGKSCNAQGGGQGDLQRLGNANTLTLASCYKSCQDRAGCVAFALQPGSWCALWGGSFTGTGGGESAWSWYDMDCFCEEASTTSGLATITGTTVTEAPTSELTTSSVDLTSTTETAPATTTTTTGAELTYSCPGGFPADSACDVKFNHIGGSVGRIVEEADGEALTSLDNCVQACAANKDCDFFAFWPNTFCELWEGNYEHDDNAAVQWSWYELSCFCVPGREATTTEAIITEATTTTEAATTTTTAPVESCINNEKSPVPSDKVCNKDGFWVGTEMNFLGSPSGAKTMESCRASCHDTDGCSYFAFTPGQSCYIYGGNIQSVTDQQTDYIWYDMDCFCDLDEPNY